MNFKKMHFIYETRKPESVALARRLMEAYGQSSLARADLVVSIGGDGLLAQAFKRAGGKAVYGITPPESNSNGFWTDHDVDGPEALARNLACAEAVTLAPLKAEIRFSNGRRTTRYAFGDIAVSTTTGQAAIINLRGVFNNVSIGPRRIMGDGLIFSTPFGSTGTSSTYNGPVIDLDSNVVLMNGKGIYEPRGLGPFVAPATNTVFTMDFTSTEGKRPMRVDYDGMHVARDKHGSPVSRLRISAAPERSVTFLVTRPPATRTFSALSPKV